MSRIECIKLRIQMYTPLYSSICLEIFHILEK